MTNAYLYSYTDENGKFWLEDNNDKVETSELVDCDLVEWDEYEGWILPDGRKIWDVIIG